MATAAPTSPGSQVIIGITGTNGAGKGTVVEILMEQLGFKHYSARGYLTKILNEQGKELTRANMNELANGLRAAHHPAILAEKLLEEAQKDGGNAVIESIRTPGEATMLSKYKNFQLLAVDAGSRMRYERVVVRGSSTDKIPYEQFVAEEEKEMTSTDPNKQNISKCFEMAHATLRNEGSVEELQAQLMKYLATLGITATAAAAEVPVNQVARVVRLKIDGEEPAVKLDALVRSSAFDAVRAAPGFVKINRQVCKTEWVYELSFVFDSGANFEAFMGSQTRKDLDGAWATVKALAVDGTVNFGARVHDDF